MCAEIEVCFRDRHVATLYATMPWVLYCDIYRTCAAGVRLNVWRIISECEECSSPANGLAQPIIRLLVTYEIAKGSDMRIRARHTLEIPSGLGPAGRDVQQHPFREL